MSANKEREDFEAWYAAHWAKATSKTQGIVELVAIVVTMRDGEKYHDGYGNDTPYLNHLWEGWLARATPPSTSTDGAQTASPKEHP